MAPGQLEDLIDLLLEGLDLHRFGQHPDRRLVVDRESGCGRGLDRSSDLVGFDRVEGLAGDGHRAVDQGELTVVGPVEQGSQDGRHHPGVGVGDPIGDGGPVVDLVARGDDGGRESFLAPIPS